MTRTEDALKRFRLALIRRGLDEARTAAVTGGGHSDLPVAGRDTAWDGPGATRRVFEWADGDTDRIARAFLWRDPDADPTTQAAYKLGFADVIDGRLTIVPRGVAAIAGGRGVDATTGIPDADKARIRGRVCALYAHIRGQFEDWPPCPFDDEEETS